MFLLSAFFDESQQFQNFHDGVAFSWNFLDLSGGNLGEGGQVERNDKFGDVVAARIVASDDDLGIVLNTARVVALTFSVRNRSLVRDDKVLSDGKLSQSSDGKSEDLEKLQS